MLCAAAVLSLATYVPPPLAIGASLQHSSSRASVIKLCQDGPPLALRPMSRGEVLDRLNAVPVFAVVNEDEQLLATPAE